MKSDQALGDASTCHLNARNTSVLDKKKMKFGTNTHHLHGLLDCVNMDIWGPTKNESLGGHQYFISIVDDYSSHCWVYPIRQRVKDLELLVK